MFFQMVKQDKNLNLSREEPDQNQQGKRNLNLKIKEHKIKRTGHLLKKAMYHLNLEKIQDLNQKRA